MRSPRLSQKDNKGAIIGKITKRQLAKYEKPGVQRRASSSQENQMTSMNKRVRFFLVFIWQSDEEEEA